MRDQDVVEASAALLKDLSPYMECKDVVAVMEVIECGLRRFVGIEKELGKDRIWKRQQFDSWWQIYGKKVKKTPAHAKWMRLRRREIEDIMCTVQDFVKTHPDPQYRPDPTTYLNQKRWEDDLGQKQPKIKFDTIKNTFSYD